jgi:hypothetical protein
VAAVDACSRTDRVAGAFLTALITGGLHCIPSDVTLPLETKDALVAEWLRIVAADYRAAFDRVEAEHPDRPEEQIRGLARFIAEGLPEISRRGCPFINFIAEFPDRSHPARVIRRSRSARHTITTP